MEIRQIIKNSSVSVILLIVCVILDFTACAYGKNEVNLPYINLSINPEVSKMLTSILDQSDTMKYRISKPHFYHITISDSKDKKDSLEYVVSEYHLTHNRQLDFEYNNSSKLYGWFEFKNNLFVVSGNSKNLIKYVIKSKATERRFIIAVPSFPVVDNVPRVWVCSIYNCKLYWIKFYTGFKYLKFVPKNKFDEISITFHDTIKEAVEKQIAETGIEPMFWKESSINDYFLIAPED